MSPIRQDTIRVEVFTQTTDGRFKQPGRKEYQVLAEGDGADPGFYVYQRGVYKKNENFVRSTNLLVDVAVDPQTGDILNEGYLRGIWRRYKER